VNGQWRIKRRGSESDNKIKHMMIVISRKINMLSEIGRIKSRYRNCLTWESSGISRWRLKSPENKYYSLDQKTFLIQVVKVWAMKTPIKFVVHIIRIHATRINGIINSILSVIYYLFINNILLINKRTDLRLPPFLFHSLGRSPPVPMRWVGSKV